MEDVSFGIATLFHEGGSKYAEEWRFPSFELIYVISTSVVAVREFSIS